MTFSPNDLTLADLERDPMVPRSDFDKLRQQAIHLVNSFAQQDQALTKKQSEALVALHCTLTQFAKEYN